MYNSQNIQIALSNLKNENIKNDENRNGFYRAIVINNKDPYNIARIKVRIPAFHGTSSLQSFYIPDDGLPYAWPATLNTAGYHSGQYMIPVEGSLVWVSFETGTDNLIYFGGIYGAKPEGDRYLYFDRNVNHGEPIKVEDDDIPSTYNINKYVLFKSPKGASISIDDRDSFENIMLEDTHGNSISMNKNGILLRSNEYLVANLPSYNIYYMKVDKVQPTPLYTIEFSNLYTDINLTEAPSKAIVGSKIIYLNENKEVAGSGVLQRYMGDTVTISNNGLNGTGGSSSSDSSLVLWDEES